MQLIQRALATSLAHLIALATPFADVPGHDDWSVHNVRLQTDRNGNPVLSIVYDWDSLTVARETDILGIAAAIFTVTFDLEVVPRFHTRDEMVAFVRPMTSLLTMLHSD